MYLTRKIRVLIAEDHADTALMLKTSLSIEGLDSVWVSDGVDALQSIEHQRPDLLLTDLNMPRKDGIALIKEVREREESQQSSSHLPIVVLSARVDSFS